MPPIRAVIIGTGLIAGKKHIPAFLKLRKKAKLVAVCDLNLEAAQKVAKSFGIPMAYGDIEEMLASENPEIVDICTPPQTHARLAIQVMKHGSHVFIEKPMAVSVADCDEIVDAATHYGVKIAVGHSDLFYDSFIHARKLVAAGAIGEFRGMRIFLSTPTDYMTAKPEHWANKLPGGVIGESGPHIVYMTLAFIKSIRAVQVQALHVLDYAWSPFEDYRIELIGDRAISSVTLSYTGNQWAAQVDILGSTGRLSLDLQSQSLVKYNRTALTPAGVAGSSFSEAFQQSCSTLMNGLRFATHRHQSTHDALISSFIDSVATGSAVPVTATEGREAVRVMALIVEQIESKNAQSKTPG